MLRDKVATRILLILFVVHVAAAAPAAIRQRYLEATNKVTPALEKRANLDDESSHLFPRIDNLPSTPGAPPSQDDTLPGSGTLQSQDETSPTPGDPRLHSGPVPELGTSQLHIDQPPTSGSPQLYIDHPPTSGTPQYLPPTPGAPPSQDNPLPASGTPFLHNDQRHQPSTPGASPSQDDTLPGSGTLQSQDETSPTPGDPQLHSGPLPELGTSQLHIDQPPTSGTPQLHEDPWPHWADNFWRDEVPGSPPFPDGPFSFGDLGGDGLFSFGDFGGTSNEESVGTWPPTSGTSLLQNDPPPASGTPQLHHDGSEEFDRSHRWLNDPRVIDGGPSSSNFDLEVAPPLHSEALPSAPETPGPTFFNDALRQKLKEYAIVSAVSGGASVGLVLGLEKLINHHSHASQPAGRDLASSGVVGRGANMHPRPPKNPVSRAPAKLRDEDLRLLSILTRRALERLD